MDVASEQAAQATQDIAQAIEQVVQRATNQAKDAEKSANTIVLLGQLIYKSIKDAETMNHEAANVSMVSNEGLAAINNLIEKRI